ncbi:hypothetical protein Bhyg_14092, partial [Pseudolycoriella hygida]
MKFRRKTLKKYHQLRFEYMIAPHRCQSSIECSTIETPGIIFLHLPHIRRIR